MFDLWVGDVNIAPIFFAISILVVFPIQLLLCFKVKMIIVRLIPVLIFTALLILFTVMFFATSDWSKIAYLIFIIYALFLLLMSGFAWGVCAVSRKIRQKSN